MKLQNIAALAILIKSSFVYALNERIHCEGYFTAILNDTEQMTFSGEYVWDILQGAPSYVSLEGELLYPPKKYTVHRTFNVKANILNKEDSIYELIPLKTTMQSDDNLPDFITLRYFFHKPRIYRIQKTLISSYLISNSFTPVFICHDIQ